MGRRKGGLIKIVGRDNSIDKNVYLSCIILSARKLVERFWEVLLGGMCEIYRFGSKSKEDTSGRKI